jgi:hypothetical protein
MTPYIPGTPPSWPRPVDPDRMARDLPFQMPQYDPMGNPTGPAGPGVPAASPMGYPPVPQPTDMIPPMAGPGADRNVPGGQPDIGQSLQPGQSAASTLLQGIQGRFNNPMGSPITPPGGAVPAGAAQGPVMPAPPTGPGSDRTPPPGLLGSLGGIPDFLKRNIPPFGGI